MPTISEQLASLAREIVDLRKSLETAMACNDSKRIEEYQHKINEIDTKMNEVMSKANIEDLIATLEQILYFSPPSKRPSLN